MPVNQEPVNLIPNFDIKLLQIMIQIDGNPLGLLYFIDPANTLIGIQIRKELTVFKITLIDGIYSKLVEKTKQVYSICIDKNWYSIKNALVAHFGDQIDENDLLFDLDQFRQNYKESSLKFCIRVMSNLSALPTTTNSKYYSQPNRNFSLQHFPFPRGPIPIQPRPVQQQKIYTNNQGTLVMLQNAVAMSVST